MKRFYKNTLISRVSNSALRVVALLCVLLGVSSTAWAETGFFENLDIKINGKWYNLPKNGDNRSEAEQNLGNYLPGQGPSLEEFYYRTYKNNDNVCSENSGIYVKIETNAEKQWGNNVHLTTREGDGEWDGDNGSINQEWTGYADNTIFSSITSTGKKEIKLKAKVKVGNDCTQNNYIEMSNKDNFTLDNNYNSYYYFYYNVVKPIYVYGDAIDNDYSPCEPTADADVVRYKLDKYKSWLKFSDKNSENLDGFYKNASYRFADQQTAWAHKGAHINKHDNKGGNSLEEIQLDEQKGYTEPVYFYYNTKTNTYWVEASQKASYSIVFENGPEMGCNAIDQGTPCSNSVDLEEGSYQFKIYKNGEPYYYSHSPIENKLGKSDLTAGDQSTTINIDHYGTCTFTLIEEAGKFRLTITYKKLEDPIVLTYNPILSNNNKSVTLSAYLQKNLCGSAITQYGFVICPGGNSGCIPDKNSIRIQGSSGQINRGSDITCTTGITENNLIGGVTYGYRAFVEIDGEIYLSKETNYFRLDDDCIPQQCCGDPINFTIDASLGEDYENDCKLVYGSLQTAIEKLKDSYTNEDENFRYVTHTTIGTSNSYNLQQPVVFNVRYYDDTPDDDTQPYIYRGTKDVGSYAGENKPEYANLIKDINREGAVATNTLTIKAGSNVAKPWVHHIVIRNSKNIVLDSLAIFSDPADYDSKKDGVQTKGDNAIEIDVNSTNWPGLGIGECSTANILIQNCIIGSDGFTGIHVSAYDGVTFKNNDFEAVFTSASGNDIDWGASAKFIACKNIKFVQNNFRGDHATLMWLQETQNVLLMNNVFWNTNNYVAGGTSDTPTAIRLVAQYNKDVKNVGCYYNTFYLAENKDKTTDYKYNFLQFSLTKATNGGSKDKFIDNTIEFMYNNCYSYASHCVRRDSDPFLDKEANFTLCPNNFWSEYDQAIYDDLTDDKKAIYTSAFAFGSCKEQNKFINVKNEVCSTTASGPSSLIVKGTTMNKGVKPNVSITEFTLEKNEQYADRYIIGARPETDKEWTYGAYQSRDNVPTETIYWVGVSSDWDDRNNWEYETKEDPKDPDSKLIRQRVTCVNTFSENLRVVVEEIGSIEVSGGRKWPAIPQFNGTRSNSQYNEHVNAGLGKIANPTKFAKSIELEYGAAIHGIENLGAAEYYTEATTHFVAPRSKWLLVGTVVKPFTEKGNVSSAPRYVQSGDFYLNHKPQVYMHYVEDVDADGTTKWAKTFTDLNINLEEDKVYAVNIPDQYGTAKLPLQYYSMYFDDVPAGDEKLDKEFTFNGRFADEKGMRTYSGLTAGTPVLLNNTYPSNLSANQIEAETNGQVMYYDYINGSFKSFDNSKENVQIKPQQGFVFISKDGSDLAINTNMLASGNTRTRSVEQQLPVVSINLQNANQAFGNSNIIVRYDEMLEAGMQSTTDAKKVFASNDFVPELYMMAYNQNLARLTTSNASQMIPLGIRILKPMNVRFEKNYFEGFDKVILVDTQRGIEYDLLSKPFTTEVLPAGVIEGRYFLNLVPSENNDYVEDDDITTDISEMEDNTSIDIYVVNNNSICIIAANTELQTVFVSDMVGRTIQYQVSGNSATITLPFAQGVYAVQVISEKLTRSEKVILK